MATKNSTGAPERSVISPTAPLPTPAVAALARLELRLAFPKPVVDAVTRYESAALHAAELAAKAATGNGLPALDVRSWEFAEELMAGSRATLADAGLLHLVASDDHAKANEPRLPQRPRGPHPQTAGA
jgi:hypothetical protein